MPLIKATILMITVAFAGFMLYGAFRQIGKLLWFIFKGWKER